MKPKLIQIYLENGDSISLKFEGDAIKIETAKGIDSKLTLELEE